MKPLAGSRLFSKVAAQEFRKRCNNLLIEDQLLIINMSGVKALTPGYAFSAFGYLYLDSLEKGAKIKFKGVKPELRSMLYQSIKDALDLASA